MKKILALLLSLSLAVPLTACGSSSSSSSGEEGSGSSYTEASSTDKNAADNMDITFEEMTVAENDDCVIKITDISPDTMLGYTLNVELENKSADKTYMFAVESAAINGVVCDPLFAVEVAAGKKSTNEINFLDSTLEENGIVDFTDIELTFRVYNSDDWNEDAVVHETVHVYPYGEENAVKFIRDAQDTDNVLIDNDAVSVIVTGYEYDDIWGYTVNLYLENKTDTEVMFGVDDASINGYMMDPFYAKSVPSGDCAFSSMSWYEDDLEANGISEVEQIEFRLKAYNYENWSDDYYVDEAITLNP